MAVEEQRAVARTQRAGALATDAPANPWADVGLLKPHAGGLVQEAPRVDALATISAGFKNDKGYPERSRDGTIYLHDPSGRAPGLRAALAERGNKALTIALVHNDPKEVLQQRFAAYSKTRLLAYGDERVMTVIHTRDTGQRDRGGQPIVEATRETITRAQSPDRYAQIAAGCKAQSSLYFALAAWTEDGQPRLIFPDGLGLYRLRFTSLNSAEAIRGQLAHVANLTNGLVAGIPLELAIDYREVAGPDGSRRQVPVWTLVLRPPTTIQLEASRVRGILEGGIEQARSLALAAPRPETVELAEYEGPDVDLDTAEIVEGRSVPMPSQQAVRQLAGGGPLGNPDRAKAEFFLLTRKSALHEPDGYRPLLLAFTKGRTDSIKTFAETTTSHEWLDWLGVVADWMRQEAEARQAGDLPPVQQASPSERSYEQIFPADDFEQGSEPVAQTLNVPPAGVSAEVHAAAVLTGAPIAAGPVEREEDNDPTPERPNWHQGYKRTELFLLYEEWGAAMQRLDRMWQPENVKRLSDEGLRRTIDGLIAEYDNLREILASTDDVADEEPDDATTTAAF